jgi:hypothetical protein
MTHLPLMMAIAALTLTPTPVGLTQELRLALELKTAAICMINEGGPWPTVIKELYRFLERERISHPKPDSQAATVMWQKAIKRATPAKCNNLLRPGTYTL